MSIANPRSSVAYAALFVASVFLVGLILLWMALGSFEDAFFGASIGAMLLLAAACVFIPNRVFRSAALVAGSAFLVFACAVLFAFWVDDDDSLATILMALGAVLSLGASGVFLWRHRRIEPWHGFFGHFVAGMPFVGPARTLWDIFV